MKISNMQMNPAEIQERLMEKQSFQHKTGLEFLSAHKGYRNGNVHIFMGVSGAGKSTLLRTLIRDYQSNNLSSSLGVWLSEETINDLKDEWSKVYDDSDVIMSKIIAVSEMEEMNRGNLWELKANIKTFIQDNNISILFLDNITTSALYAGKKPNEQEDMQGFLKSLCIECGIPFVIFAHTDSSVNENIPRLINMNDIRGNKGIVNLAQYFYIMQRFEIGKMYFPTLRMTKYRGYSVDQRLFYLDYDSEKSVFGKDWVLPWDEFILAYQKRNILK